MAMDVRSRLDVSYTERASQAVWYAYRPEHSDSGRTKLTEWFNSETLDDRIRNDGRTGLYSDALRSLISMK